MKYEKIVKGIFIERPNRFIAHIDVDGKVETVHVKNTGRCKELLIPGCTVILEDFRNRKGFENRKTKFDLIAVYKEVVSGSVPSANQITQLGIHLGTDPSKNSTKKNLLINMDSQAPNKVVHEWLCSLTQQTSFDFIKPEFTYGKSRVDFYMEKADQKYLMEVKGCTLEKNGTGYFPDAPTERGVKHLYELAEACNNGFKCYIAFVIQIPGVTEVLPNIETHAEFGKALDYAKKNGVQVLFLPCDIKEDELQIKPQIPFIS